MHTDNAGTHDDFFDGPLHRDQTYANLSRDWTSKYLSFVPVTDGEVNQGKPVKAKAICWACSTREGKLVYLTTSLDDPFKWPRQHVAIQHSRLRNADKAGAQTERRRCVLS